VAKIAFLIPFFPLIGFLINGLFGRHVKRSHSGLIASGAVILSFIFGLVLFFSKSIPATFHFFEWIHLGSLQINFAYHVDELTLVMLLTVSGVASLIHIYSIGYMSHDPGYNRYFSYLNLFTAMMLILVMAENLPVMFIGWEGVGLCSYLLIGFWFEKPEAANAGRKAFVVNRIGDAAFIVGMLLLYNYFGTLSIQPIIERAPDVFAYGSAVITTITILLFIGAIGKSAQIPLFVWLPDAMEGPTPVSALIHAATMVTAGIYMICRLNLLYLMSPTTLWIIGIIATLTALFAGLTAIAQYDIKRVLAYSTISQLGYMFMACSVGAFGAAIFHLVTHAFFKALLFLGSGAVIHGLDNEKDMRKMGGLKKSMPVTRWTFLIGTAAIAGFPFLAGFFSKDLIIESAWVNPLYNKKIICVLGYLTAIITAFYMFRLYYRIFHGRYLGPENVHPHKAPQNMAVPLIILAIFSVFAGFLGWPLNNIFGHYLDPVFGENFHHVAEHLKVDVSHHAGIPITFWIISFACFIIGWFFAWVFFLLAPETSVAWKRALPGLFKTLNRKFYVDEFYNSTIVATGKVLFTRIWQGIDLGFIDAIVNGIGAWSVALGRMCSKLTTGYVRNYALYIVIGIILLLWMIQK